MNAALSAPAAAGPIGLGAGMLMPARVPVEGAPTPPNIELLTLMLAPAPPNAAAPGQPPIGALAGEEKGNCSPDESTAAPRPARCTGAGDANGAMLEPNGAGVRGTAVDRAVKAVAAPGVVAG